MLKKVLKKVSKKVLKKSSVSVFWECSTFSRSVNTLCLGVFELKMVENSVEKSVEKSVETMVDKMVDSPQESVRKKC